VVDLERVDRLDRLLPAALLDGSGIGDLLPRLSQIDVQHRVVDEEVADQPPVNEGAPMHARAEERDARDRRLRMRVLHHEHAPQVEREAQGMEVELLEVDGIACRARFILASV
jgi:hypothetical protein